jgi:molybdopterin synthase catalytic subunit
VKLRVEIVRRKFSPARLLRSLELASECGAAVTFTGVVRGTERGQPIEALEYSCYESMAQAQIEKIARTAGKRWPVQAITLIHRTGRIRVGEAAIFIAVQSAHRKEPSPPASISSTD